MKTLGAIFLVLIILAFISTGGLGILGGVMAVILGAIGTVVAVIVGVVGGMIGLVAGLLGGLAVLIVPIIALALIIAGVVHLVAGL